MFSEVIVGVDDRSGGRDAIPLATTLLASGGRLTLARVITSDPSFYRGVGAAVAEAERAEALELLETERVRAGSRRGCAAGGGRRWDAGCTRSQKTSAVTFSSLARRPGAGWVAS